MSFNTLACITNTSRKLQCVRFARYQHISPSDPQDTSHQPLYLFTINFLGRSRQLEAITIHEYLEALKMLQSYQAPYCKAILYSYVLIGQISPTVSFPRANQLVHSSWFSHSPRFVQDTLDNFSFLWATNWIIRVDYQNLIVLFKNFFSIREMWLVTSSWSYNPPRSGR